MNRYDLIDSAPDWKLNRLRFSLAHEIGHLFLHRKAFEEANIGDVAHYLEWINDHNGRKYSIEREANEFAGRLLVPVESLQQCFDQMLPEFDRLFGRHAWIRDDCLRCKAADRPEDSRPGKDLLRHRRMKPYSFWHQI